MYDFGNLRARSGYRIQYRPGQANHCPGCGKSQWNVGRFSAECAFCGTVVEIIGTPARGCATPRAAA